jgi:hypothetical protein
MALGRLPPPARAKYNKLVTEAEDADALVRPTYERRKLLENSYVSLRARVSMVDSRNESPERVAELKAELEQARAAYDAVDQQLSARNDGKARADQMVAQLQHFLVGQASGPVQLAGVASSMRKGEGLQAAIDRVRNELSKAQSALASVKAAVSTRAEIEQQLHDYINSLREHGPHWTLEGNKVVVHSPDMTQFSGTGVFSAPSGSAIKLFAALLPDQLYAALTSGLDQWPEGLTTAERERRTQELEQQIRNLEHQEEHLITQALAQGLAVQRIYRNGWATLGLAPQRPQMEAAE